MRTPHPLFRAFPLLAKTLYGGWLIALQAQAISFKIKGLATRRSLWRAA
jgi:hypothetical protein